MQTVTTIGLDIAKSVFQLHGVDGAGHHPDGRPVPGWRRIDAREGRNPMFDHYSMVI